jgi:excisionase family DNA binding protein
MNGRLLTPEDVARRTGLSRRAVYRAIERGDLQASRLCSRLRIREADYEAWIEANIVEIPQHAGSPPPPPRPATGGLRRFVA